MEDELDSTMNNIKSLIGSSILSSFDDSKPEESKLADRPDEEENADDT